jgi:hypothetical protein
VSQADAPKSGAVIMARAVWLVLGARQVLWGAVLGSGQAARWESWGRVDVLGDPQITRQSLMSALATLPNAPFANAAPNTPLHVWLADPWVSMDVVPWSDGFLREASAISLAREHLMEQGHEVHGADRLRLDDVSLGQPRLAVAYPGEVLAWVEERARVWSLRLRSVRGASVACWSAFGRGAASPMLAVLHDEAWVVMGAPGSQVRGADLAELHVVPLEGGACIGPQGAPSCEPGWTGQLAHGWRRLALRFPQWSSITEVPLINCRRDDLGHAEWPAPFVRMKTGTVRTDAVEQSLSDVLVALVDSAQPHALDAVSDRRPRKAVLVPLAMALCLGVLLLGSMAWSRTHLKASIEAAVARYNQPASPSTPANPLTKQEALRIPAINQAIRQLNLPVHALLHSLEPPRDLMVAVLSVDSVGQGAPSRQSSSVRIVAQTPSSADMMRYVAFVSGRRPFTGAYLRKHEWIDGPNQKQVRFTVEATWNN